MVINPFAAPTTEELDMITRMTALARSMPVAPEQTTARTEGTTIYPWLDDPAQWGTFHPWSPVES